MNWSEDTATCGNTEVLFTVTETGDYDYISKTSNNELSFDLSSLTNRDVVDGNYERPVTLNVDVRYVDRTGVTISQVFKVKEYDCRPQTSPELMTVFANYDPTTSHTYTDFEDLGLSTD